MSMLRYVTHADVEIDPRRPVTEWGLSPAGRERVTAMLGQPWVGSIERIVTSSERKALETATIVGGHLGVDVEVREALGETDRSATGFVPHARHEALAQRFFARPHESAEGWERAIDVQRRAYGALDDLLSVDDGHDVMAIGHGAAGTLLWCRLAGRPIDRRHDQPAQGHHWCFDRSRRSMVHGWQPIDLLTDA